MTFFSVLHRFKFSGFLLVVAAGAFSQDAHASRSLPSSCYNSCSAQCQSDLDRLEIEILQFRNTSCNSAPNPAPGSGSGVLLYHSDSCESSSLIAAANAGTNCQALAETSSSSVWAVKLGNQCLNISDTSIEKACTLYQGGGSGTQFYHSDSCSSGELLAVVDYGSNCDKLAEMVNSSVWAIKYNGTCFDISDRNIETVCARFKGGADSVALYHSDSCNPSDLIGLVGRGTKCSDPAQPSESVWAVSINGQCQNISDLSYEDACIRFGGH
jgi:hypothetical protein